MACPAYRLTRKCTASQQKLVSIGAKEWLADAIYHLQIARAPCVPAQVKAWLAGDEPVLQLTLANSFERLLCFQ
eukprot:scaffold139080_cov22-Tisochrysis_lutea.AAC.1